MFKNKWKLTFFKTIIDVFAYEIPEKVSIKFNNLSSNNTLLRSLFHIQGFDKFNNFTGTSISKGKICIKIFSFYICNTRVIFKISERFFEWIIIVIKLIVWNISNFKLINCFREKIIKNSAQFIVVWNCFNPLCLICFPLFDNLSKRSVFQNVRLSVNFLMSKLLK